MGCVSVLGGARSGSRLGNSCELTTPVSEAYVATGPGTYAPGRVIDKTGLTDKYDFHFEVAEAFVGSAFAPGPSPAAQAGYEGMLDVSEPCGGPNLFTALEKQLGLRLTKTKTTIEVLVVDHALRVPTENR